MNKKRLLLLLLLVVAVFTLGYLARGTRKPADEPAAPAGEKAALWTCAMHPQIKLPKAGRCPICGMELVEVKKSGEGETRGGRFLTMSEEAKELAEIQTSPVERMFVTVVVRMVGKVEYDETRLAYITAWIPGRLDRLYVDYTGVSVKKGDHMVSIYSPEILSTQEELLQALRAVEDLRKSDIGIMKATTLGTVEAARERLRLWGLTAEQIEEIEKGGNPSDHITIYAPIGGIVVHKNALEGMYVDEGTKIYTIADLSRVWVMLDAYESDLKWIRYGQEVEFATEAYPGEMFKGQISFIDPVLNEKTRTVKVRVNADNSEGKLKPGMFVRALVKSRVATAGRVMDPSLAGKWICPMHPDVIEDSAGDCPICGMPLVRTETLGYVRVDEKAAAPLVIPASAPLITGKRAVVYVRVPGTDRPTFEGREIVLGPRAGDYYIVRTGLKEGEMVVTRGNFKIDSAIQIEAKPSMMLPEGGGGGAMQHHGGMSAKKGKGEEKKKTPMTVPAAFRSALSPLYGAYFKIQEALAMDETAAARRGYEAFRKAVELVDAKTVEGHTRMTWMDLARKLSNDAVIGRDAGTPGEAREAFRDLSKNIVSMERNFGHAGREIYYLFFCGDLFDGKGAFWLQKGEEPLNPYRGRTVRKCGDIEERFEGKGGSVDSRASAVGRKTAVPAGEVREAAAELPERVGTRLTDLVEAYLVLQECLAADDRACASDAAKGVSKALGAVDAGILKEPARSLWSKEERDLKESLRRISEAREIEGQRRGFALLSEVMSVVLARFQPPIEKAIYRFRCPMAFGGRGATWLQASADVRNPYFGKTMPRCGELIPL